MISRLLISFLDGVFCCFMLLPWRVLGYNAVGSMIGCCSKEKETVKVDSIDLNHHYMGNFQLKSYMKLRRAISIISDQSKSVVRGGFIGKG